MRRSIEDSPQRMRASLARNLHQQVSRLPPGGCARRRPTSRAAQAAARRPLCAYPIQMRILALLTVLQLLVVACDAAPAARPAPGPRAIAVTLTSVPAGAVVLVDGAALGESPQTVPLNPGPHRLRATMSGYYPAPEQRFVVGTGEPTQVAITLTASH